MNKKVYFILVFCYPFLLSAQEDLRKDEAFFKRQQSVYQKWLDVVGLGDRLKVHAVTVEEAVVNLYLTIPSPYSERDSLADYVLLTWQELERAYNAANPIDLKTQLFLKMLHNMDLQPEQAIIQLYDTYDVTLQYLVFIGIYFEGGSIQIKTEGPKSTTHAVKIFRADLSENTHGRASILKSTRADNLEVFNKVKSYMKKEYEAAEVEVNSLILEDTLFEFTIYPLEKEVLANQEESLICSWLKRLSFDCNTLKKEKLNFTFTIIPYHYGYELKCMLDGKFSERINFFSARGAYKSIDIDPESKKILQSYGDLFMGKLQEYLME